MTLPSPRILAVGGAAAALLVGVMVARNNEPGDTTAPVARQGAKRTAALGDAAVADVHLELLRGTRAKVEEPERNLFRFQTKPAPAVKLPLAKPAAPALNGPPEAPAGPPPPPPISLRFIGIVDAPTQAGRVAILTDGRGSIVYGKEGDIIEGRYKVLKISADAAELSYLDGRGRQTIRLTGQ